LSLHRKDVLPFAPTHPWLDERWRTVVGCLPLADTGSIPVSIPVCEDWVLTITREPVSMLPDDWRSPNQPWRTYVDAAQVGKLVLTTPRPGQRFAPLGLAGRHKTLGDFFTDRKIPGALRSGWPLLVDAMTDTVLWVCGEQPGHHARLTPNTQQVLRLTWYQARDGQETTHAN
jgi:tRNA(Ile)-lysidine synthase